MKQEKSNLCGQFKIGKIRSIREEDDSIILKIDYNSSDSICQRHYIVIKS